MDRSRSHSKSSLFQSPSSENLVLKMAIEASLTGAQPSPPETSPANTVAKDLVVDSTPKKSKKKQRKGRCFGCSKRVGLLGFECRCTHVFCSKCRMPENHDCPEDWATPLKGGEKVVASKLDRI